VSRQRGERGLPVLYVKRREEGDDANLEGGTGPT
jgi:hypothetical protein